MKVQEWIKTLHYQIIIKVPTLFVQGVEESTNLGILNFFTSIIIS